MKSFYLFFLIVFIVFALVNYYLIHRFMQLLPANFPFRTGIHIILWFFAASFFIGRIFEKQLPAVLADFLIVTGSVWMAFLTYGVLLALLGDIVRLLDRGLHFLPQGWVAGDHNGKILLASVALVLLTVLGGARNAARTVVRHYELAVNKPVPGRQELKIVLASDIHMGTIMGNRQIGRLVRLINAEKPDLILFAGDIVDGDITPVIERDLGRHLTELKAPLGVYGITGNHEFIGGVKPSLAYLEKHGITMLLDSVVSIRDAFYLAGRTDLHGRRSDSTRRLETARLLAEADTSRPIILMDHQPFHLEHSEIAGVDLHLSGHTHDGQLWPFNYITRAIYEVSAGYKQKGNMHVYVSSGFGTWGPPVRVGRPSEIVVFYLKFTGQ